jgi:hypothetical protein
MTLPPTTALFLCLIAVASAQQQPSTQSVTLPAAVPLHIRVTRSTALKRGARVDGVLTTPVFVQDRLVLPKGSVVRGSVIATRPAPALVRTKALLDGDVTPLREPIVNFSSIHLSSTGDDLPLQSHALIRATQMIRFTPAGPKPSLPHRIAAAVRKRAEGLVHVITGPDKKDRALRLLYSQLPYHPQRIWTGTEFIADLDNPAVVELPAQSPLPLSNAAELDHIDVTARLTRDVTSATAKKGDAVTALATQPVFDADHRLVLPEGAELHGSVAQSRPARSFSRNGRLRIVFTDVKRPDTQERTGHGTVTGAAGVSGANLSIDHEGGVKANDPGNRFLAPVLLGAIAFSHRRHDNDGPNGVGGQTIASNGFGLAARIVALTVADPNVTRGFAYYAFGKSICYRFLLPGHQVVFPKDTLVEVRFVAH